MGETKNDAINHAPNLCRSLYHLARFELKRLIRSPSLVLTHIVVSAAMGIVVGIVYYKMRNDLKGTLNRLFSLFTMMTFCALMGTSAVSLFQGVEKLRFIRERASGYYSTLSYLMAKLLFDDLFLRLIPSVIFSIITYKMINYAKVWTESDFYNSTSKTILPGSVCSASKMPFQRLGACADELKKAAISEKLPVSQLMESMKFYRSLPVFCLIMFLTSSISSSLCAAIGMLTSTNRVGTFVAVLMILIFTMFSGALINNNLLANGSWVFGWMRFVSPFEYALEGLLVSHISRSVRVKSSGNIPFVC